MKQLKHICEVCLPHLCIVLSGMVIVFFIVNLLNEAMGFWENEATRILIVILCVLSIVQAVCWIAYLRKMKRRRQRRELEEWEELEEIDDLFEK